MRLEPLGRVVGLPLPLLVDELDAAPVDDDRVDVAGGDRDEDGPPGMGLQPEGDFHDQGSDSPRETIARRALAVNQRPTPAGAPP
jgi:hypothetical protein